MTKRSLSSIAIAGVAALLGLSLIHIDSFAAAQGNKKTRAESPSKSTKVDMPLSRDRVQPSGDEPKSGSQLSTDATGKSLVSALHLHRALYSGAARLIQRR
jgi:hypothetical protein